MYGSNFWIVTENPRAWSSLASEAEIMPFPREEVTPPVTKMYLVMARSSVGTGREGSEGAGGNGVAYARECAQSCLGRTRLNTGDKPPTRAARIFAGTKERQP